MKPNQNKLDAYTLAEWKSLKAAAKTARQLAEAMGTPFYVYRNGRIVDLNPPHVRQARQLRLVKLPKRR